MPTAVNFSVMLLAFLAIFIMVISKYKIITIKKILPYSPKLDAYTAKIKSVPDSGK